MSKPGGCLCDILDRLQIPQPDTYTGAASAPKMPKGAVMPVLLTIHGGQNALMRVVEGLVERNARAIREGAVPRLTAMSGSVQAPVAYAHEPMWRDAPNALLTGRASAGTLAAWAAAEARVTGADRKARVGLVGGQPVALVSGAIVDPSLRVGRRRGSTALAAVGALASSDPDEGLVQESMLLTIDDEWALPVREINNKIAEHNAYRIKKKKLPGIYKSGVRYKVEGLPELWWDAEQILEAGHDDCEGLAAYRAGELIAAGTPAEVWTRRIQQPGGSGNRVIFHAITRVKMPNGTYEFDDPSVRLGMPVPQWYTTYATDRRRKGLPL